MSNNPAPSPELDARADRLADLRDDLKHLLASVILKDGAATRMYCDRIRNALSAERPFDTTRSVAIDLCDFIIDETLGVQYLAHADALRPLVSALETLLENSL